MTQDVDRPGGDFFWLIVFVVGALGLLGTLGAVWWLFMPVPAAPPAPPAVEVAEVPAVPDAAAGGTFSGHGGGLDRPWWGEGDAAVMLHWPRNGGPLGRTIWMVVARYPRGARSSGLSSKTNSDGTKWETETKVTVQFASGQTMVLRHAASSQDPVEHFTAGEQQFKADAGRLFLLDLTTQPPRVVQVKADLAAAMPRPQSDIDPRPEFKVALAKLREKHAEVGRFLDQLTSPIGGK